MLELVNAFSKVTGYKINIQKVLAFLYTNKLSEGEIKKTIKRENRKLLFTVTSQGKKIPKGTLNQGPERLVHWTLILMKEIEEDTNKWKDILYLWIGIINIVKM